MNPALLRETKSFYLPLYFFPPLLKNLSFFSTLEWKGVAQAGDIDQQRSTFL